MTSSHKEFLSHSGWSDFFENQLSDLEKAGLIPARIINEERNLYRLKTCIEHFVWAAIPGKMQFESFGRSSFPAVGDWVLVDLPAQLERGIIRHILKRKSVLQRKQIGVVNDVQILSTNVDTVFVTSSMNSDLNIGRIERYLTFAWDSGATPVLLLTKADLCEPELREQLLNEMIEHFPAVNVHVLSSEKFSEADFFKNYLRAGTTSVLVGSSGVGKSTLTNFLISHKASEEIATREIREGDDKGRHTTTARSMYESVYGGLIIDTPGMRELQFTYHEAGVQTHFSDVEELIAQCRFKNCQHETEPDCAIIEALELGTLSSVHFKSYRKIKAEVRHAMRKQNPALLAEDRKIWKKRSQESRKSARRNAC